MKTNAEIFQDNIATLRAVNAGQVDGGVIYHYYWFRDQAKTKEISANTALHYFRNQDPGAFVSISGGGVLESSKKKDQAQKFLTFITGKARSGGPGEGRLRSSTRSPAVCPPTRRWCRWTNLQAPAVNPSDLNAQKVTDLMTKAGLL